MYNETIGEKLHDVANTTCIKLCAEAWLTEPGGNGATNDCERSDNPVEMVAIGEIWVVGVCVEAGGRECTLREGRAGSGDV